MFPALWIDSHPRCPPSYRWHVDSHAQDNVPHSLGHTPAMHDTTPQQAQQAEEGRSERRSLSSTSTTVAANVDHAFRMTPSIGDSERLELPPKLPAGDVPFVSSLSFSSQAGDEAIGSPRRLPAERQRIASSLNVADIAFDVSKSDRFAPLVGQEHSTSCTHVKRDLDGEVAKYVRKLT